MGGCVIVFSVVCQLLATASADELLKNVRGNVSPNSKTVSTPYDSSELTLTPLPSPKLSKPSASSDLKFKLSNSPCVSKLGPSLDSQCEHVKQPAALTPCVPPESTLTQINSSNPIELITTECSSDKIDKSKLYNGLNSLLNTLQSCFTDDFKPVSKYNKLRSCEYLSQSEGHKCSNHPLFLNRARLSEYMLPTEKNPHISPRFFDSTSIPDIATPKKRSMVSNYPDFLCSVHSNFSDSTDPCLSDTATSLVSSRSVSYLKPVTDENLTFNDFPVPEPILVDNLYQMPSLTSKVNIPSLFGPFRSTISSLRCKPYSPMDSSYDCPVPVPIESLATAVPPKVPIYRINTDSILGGNDPSIFKTKICPKTNPRAYIKSIFSTINTEPIALSETLNIIPCKVETSDFVDFVTPIPSTSNVVLNTLKLSESVPRLSSKPIIVSTDSSNNINNAPDLRYLSSPPYYTAPLSEACTCYSPPVLSPNDCLTPSTSPDILSPSIQSIPPVVASKVTTASSNRTPLKMKPKNAERLAKIIGANGDTPTVFVSFPDQSTSLQSTTLPSIIGTDVYCTKDSIVLHTPSATATTADKTSPESITATTSKVVSSINDVASKIAKSAVYSLSSYLKSVTKINPKSPTKTNQPTKTPTVTPAVTLVTPIKPTNGVNDLATLNDLINRSDLQTEDDYVDLKALETIISLLKMS